MRRVKLGHVSVPNPCSCQGFPCLGTLLRPGPYSEGSGPHPRDSARLLGSPQPQSGVRVVRTGVRLPRGGPARLIHPGCIIFSCHIVPLDLPMWWGRALFTVWLGNGVRAPRLHTIVRGTPDSGYRQWPPGPPQGRMRACRWGQSLTGYWLAAPARPLMQLLSARRWSRRLPRVSPRLTDLMPSLGHARGASSHCIDFENLSSQPSATTSRRRGIGVGGSATFLHPETGASGAYHVGLGPHARGWTTGRRRGGAQPRGGCTLLVRRFASLTTGCGEDGRANNRRAVARSLCGERELGLHLFPN
jgi:hypothetical protein